MTGLTNIYLAMPRGFCAGVKRAIDIVEKTLAEFGAPVYVRHEIVHNKHVVNTLKGKGVIFVEELAEVPDHTRPVILSAHGAETAVWNEAERRGIKLIDATCPLVERVHRQIKKLSEQKSEIIVIGKKEHPEIIGTIGQLTSADNVHIINSEAEAATFVLAAGKRAGVVTQTTLAVDEADKIINILRQNCGELSTLDKNDICYATTHRQKAIKAIAEKAQAVIVIGSKNSSNSKNLQQVALKNGAQQAWLIDDASEFDFAELEGITTLGISAGASAPEYLVQDLLAQLQKHYNNFKIHNVIVAEENIEFKS